MNDEGKVMVPFDLRKDVIDPLHDLGGKVDDLSEYVKAHVDHHEEAITTALDHREERQRAERRKRFTALARIVGGALGGLLTVLGTVWGILEALR